MTNRKIFVIALAAVATAAAAGTFMQSGRPGATQPLRAAEPVDSREIPTRADTAALPLTGLTLTSAQGATATERPRPIGAPTEAPKLISHPTAGPDSLPQIGATHRECPVRMTAEPAPAAMVAVTIDAACQPWARVTIGHEGMRFTELLNGDGHVRLMVPALAPDVRLTAMLENGDATVARTQIDDLDRYDRAVLQWTGKLGLTLNAYEFGADWNTDGHVHALNPREPAVAADGSGGFLVSLGDPGQAESMRAQVYTYPSGASRGTGDIGLTVEAQVSRVNCDLRVEAATLQLGRDGQLTHRDFNLRIPDCSALGDFLVLKTMMNDLKIASN